MSWTSYKYPPLDRQCPTPGASRGQSGFKTTDGEVITSAHTSPQHDFDDVDIDPLLLERQPRRHKRKDETCRLLAILDQLADEEAARS